MKLKYIDINGYGVLVDENAEIKDKEPFIDMRDYPHNTSDYDIYYAGSGGNVEFSNRIGAKIICAEPELNFDLPILNWRQWEVMQESLKVGLKLYVHGNYDFENGFRVGYNHNKKLYTEADMRRAIEMAERGVIDSSKIGHSIYTLDEIIQSLQKLPKFMVIEDYDVKVNKSGRVVNPFDLTQNQSECDWVISPKLITNSQGKQEVIIKEILY